MGFEMPQQVFTTKASFSRCSCKSLLRKHRCCGTKRSFLAGFCSERPRKSSEHALKHTKKATKTKRTPKKHINENASETPRKDTKKQKNASTPRKRLVSAKESLENSKAHQNMQPRKHQKQRKHLENTEHAANQRCFGALASRCCKSIIVVEHQI